MGASFASQTLRILFSFAALALAAGRAGAVPPTTIATTSSTTQYLPQSAAVTIDSGLTVSSSSTIDGAKVAISTGFVSAQDVLSFTAQNGITGSYSSVTGILTLTGSTTAANYQTALASITYNNTGGAAPNTNARVITFTLGSGLQFATTGHFYEFVSNGSNIDWATAKTAAAARTYFGLQGYLTTVGSAAENSFILTKLTGTGWMGAMAISAANVGNPTNSNGANGYPRTWYWVTGPEAGTAFFTNTGAGAGTTTSGQYTNWSGGEPNDSGGTEAYAQFYSTGVWNDLSFNGGSITAYVVEYGGMAGDPTPTLSATKSLQVGCIIDSDCTTGKYCSFTTHVCATQLGNGVAVPNDGLHNGTCSTAASVCATGVCDSTGNICGIGAGDSGCTTTSQCVSGVCISSGANAGKCLACNSNSDCSGTTPACDASTNFCASCNGDFGGSVTHACPSLVSNFCNANGSCGTCTTDTNCTTGTHNGPFCNPSNHSCGIACFADSECGSQWCDNAGGSGGMCTMKTANGTMVPADAGSCSLAVGLRVCANGVCDTHGDVCGISTGDSGCTATLQCTTGVCVASGANLGKCMSCNSATDCSGTTPICASNNCVGCQGDSGSLAANSCSASGPYCDASGACRACTGNADCAVGTHAGAICNLTVGTGHGSCMSLCNTDVDCPNKWCDNPIPGTNAGSCSTKIANGIPLAHGGACSAQQSALAQSECASGVCDPLTNLCGTSAGGNCMVNASPSWCTTGVCVTQGPLMATCQVCNSNTDCTDGTLCNPTSNQCVQCNVGIDCGAGGQICASNNTCVACTNDYGAGTVASCQVLSKPFCASGACSTCSVNSDCTTGTHGGVVCDSATGACGAACSTSADCATGNWCDNPTGGFAGVCSPKIPNGQPLPTDAATCTLVNAALACVSGVCDGNGNVCGVSAGDSGCTQDSQCVTGVCITGTGGNAGKCLSCNSSTDCANLNGTAVCNTITNLCVQCNAFSDCSGATPVCSNNVCAACNGDDGASATLACPTLANPYCAPGGICRGCTSNTDCSAGLHNGSICDTSTGVCGTACTGDAECGTGAWCNNPTSAVASGVCTPQAANGQPSASIVCSDLNALRVCLSGVCDTTTSTCGHAIGGACTGDNQCQVGTCASNGMCGSKDGDACTSTTNCQSGLCTSGHCGKGASLTSSGCGCQLGAKDDGHMWLLFAFAALLLGLGLRRRGRGRIE